MVGGKQLAHRASDVKSPGFAFGNGWPGPQPCGRNRRNDTLPPPIGGGSDADFSAEQSTNIAATTRPAVSPGRPGCSSTRPLGGHFFSPNDVYSSNPLAPSRFAEKVRDGFERCRANPDRTAKPGS